MSEKPAEHSIPAVHALHLVELVRRWDVRPEDLLEGLALDERSLANPEARLSMPTLEQLVARARLLTAEPGLGFHLGLQMRISSHGYLGFAAMTASTVREALDLAARFAPTRTTALALRWQVDGDVASLAIDERGSFGTARDVVIFALMVGIWQIGKTLTGRSLVGSAEVAFSEPSYFSRFVQVLPRVSFDRPVHRLVFDAAVLDLPLMMADPAALRLASEQCERELDALSSITRDRDLVARVRALCARKDGGFRSLEEVADELHGSVRTLKRRLAAEGTAYTSLLEEERRDRALRLLRSADLSIDEVAERVGYSDVTNFTRAFRRWTGTTPAAYRKA
jgi:AraC-like DNA-binding protein